MTTHEGMTEHVDRNVAVVPFVLHDRIRPDLIFARTRRFRRCGAGNATTNREDPTAYLFLQRPPKQRQPFL